MKTLGKLLGSAARTDVLQMLNCQPEPVGLRHVARIAGLGVRSAELALASLVRDDLVTYERTATRSLYEMNRSHPDVSILEAIFEAATRGATLQRSPSLQRQGRAILPFIHEATRMLAAAEEDRRVT